MCREPRLICDLMIHVGHAPRIVISAIFWVDNFVEQIRIDLENNLAAILRKYDKRNGTRNYQYNTI